MDYRGKVIAGSILGVGLLVGLYEIAANQHNNATPLPPQARLTAPARPSYASPSYASPVPPYDTAAARVGTIAVPGRSTTVTPGGALVPAYDTGTGTPGAVVPMNANLVPLTDGRPTTVVTTQTTAMAPEHTYHRVVVSHQHRYQRPGNVHVARGVKHTVEFAAKLPERLRL